MAETRTRTLERTATAQRTSVAERVEATHPRGERIATRERATAQEVAAYCGAPLTKRRDGSTCRRRPGWGTDHPGVGRCRYHLGNTPNHRRSAAKILARREAAAGARIGLLPDEALALADPAEQLLRALTMAAADMHYWARRVAELEAEGAELTGETVHLTGTGTGEAKRHIYVQLYEDAQHRTATIAAMCLRAKVAEERTRIARELSSVLADCMHAFAQALGHSPLDPRVRSAMRQALLPAAGV